MIEIAFALSRGSFALEVDIRADARVLALAGPSGSGKTTTLNVVAGLETPARGRIAIDGVTLFDSGAGVNLPPRARRLGYVFQEPRLFPHMSVEGNLRYGAQGGADYGEIVAGLGLGALTKRRPRDLSGGEKQRVAIGRALLSNPRALLLDEPLNAVDAARGAQILGMIEGLRDALAIPVVFVSHRIDEVGRLAGEIADFSGAGPVFAGDAAKSGLGAR